MNNYSSKKAPIIFNGHLAKREKISYIGKAKAKTGKSPVLAFPVNRGFGVVHNHVDDL